jgi:hypothetical protein
MLIQFYSRFLRMYTISHCLIVYDIEVKKFKLLRMFDNAQRPKHVANDTVNKCSYVLYNALFRQLGVY